MNNDRKNPHSHTSVFFWTIASIILVTGIFFRFWNLSSDELTFDEGIYAFRSIGYLDYLENPAQVTPIQLFVEKVAPAWLSLSFHDAPPLFFIISHIFFSLFGESVLIARLPSAFAGIGTVILFFFVTRLLFEKFENETLKKWRDWAGLLAGAIASVSFAPVAISRLNQLEAILFFMMLLNIYFFLKLLDDKRWWWAFGISFGLALLVKYTCVFLIPVYFIYLFIIHSELLKDWRWYAGWGIAGLMFLPVIIYNIKLYELLGHFDLQFAYLFGQSTPQWQGIGGKNQEPFSSIFTNLQLIYSIPFVILSLTGSIFCIARKSLGKIRWFVILNIVFILTLLTAVGSAVRFVSYLIIPAIILITLAILLIGEYFGKPKVAVALAVIFLAYETYFSANLLFQNPADYGIQKLDTYLDTSIGNARPKELVRHPNQNLDEVIKKYAQNIPATLPQIGIVYDDRISNPARLWLFSRRQFYHGIPVMPASGFFELVKSTGGKSLKGFQIFFVKAEQGTTISEVSDQNYHKMLNELFSQIPEKSLEIIKNQEKTPTFKVARFEI